MTPPIASEPYRPDIGPRITSIRSIASMPGNQPCSIPELSLFGLTEREFTFFPSTMMTVYALPIPRILISDELPPPVTTTPGTSLSASVTSLYAFFPISSCDNTEIEAAAFLISCSNPLADTTIVCNCVVSFSFVVSIVSFAIANELIAPTTAKAKVDLVRFLPITHTPKYKKRRNCVNFVGHFNKW